MTTFLIAIGSTIILFFCVLIYSLCKMAAWADQDLAEEAAIKSDGNPSDLLLTPFQIHRGGLERSVKRGILKIPARKGQEE